MKHGIFGAFWVVEVGLCVRTTRVGKAKSAICGLLDYAKTVVKRHLFPRDLDKIRTR